MKRFYQQLSVIPAEAGQEAFQRYPEGRAIKLDTGLRRYDVKILPEIESLIRNYFTNGNHFFNLARNY
jgi:hypothetical protein